MYIRAVAHFTHIQIIFFSKNSQVLTEKSSSSAKMEVLSVKVIYIAH